MIQQVSLIRLIDINDSDYNKINDCYNFANDLYLESIKQLQNNTPIIKYLSEYTFKYKSYEKISIDFIDIIKKIALRDFEIKKVKNKLNIVNVDIFNDDVKILKNKIFINMLDMDIKTNFKIKKIFSFKIRKIDQLYILTIDCQLDNSEDSNYLAINLINSKSMLIAFSDVALQPLKCTLNAPEQTITFLNKIILEDKIDRVIMPLCVNKQALNIYKNFSSKIIIVNIRNIGKSNFFKGEKASIEQFNYIDEIQDINLNKAYQLINKCDDDVFINQSKYTDKPIYINI